METEQLLKQLAGLPQEKVLKAYLAIQGEAAKVNGQLAALKSKIQVSMWSPQNVMKEIDSINDAAKKRIGEIVDELTQEVLL